MNLFSPFGRKKTTARTAHSQLVLDGVSVPVSLRTNPRAKRIILRMDKSGNGIVLTLPPGTSQRRAMEFAASQGVWISQQMARQPDIVPFSAGFQIPVRGVLHKIVANNEKRTPVWLDRNAADGPVMCVSGDPTHHHRRIRDWLIKQARKDLSGAAHDYAEKMGGKISRISIRDTASRWGSCSSNGALSFSWRLVLAPPFVLDYVAAHEAAHLREMNHSAAFWSLVGQHCPASNEARKWLKKNGRSLHCYGAKQ